MNPSAPSDAPHDFASPAEEQPPAALNPDAVLTAEYNYAAQTAFQANEDRARVTSFFLVSVGSLAAGILGAQSDALRTAGAYAAFAVLFLLLALSGVLTVMQLARLRLAWRESMRALAQIKAYYARRFDAIHLVEAFRWSERSLPPAYKPWSISHLLALEVSLLGGGMLGAALVFTGLSLNRAWTWPAAAAGLIFTGLQMLLYRFLLTRRPK